MTDSSTNTGTIIVSLFGGGVLTGLFGWVGRLILKMLARRNAQEDDLVATLKVSVAKLTERVASLEAENRKLWMVIGYVVPALHMHDPTSEALKIAGKILKDSMPIDLNTPPDMTATLDKIT